LLAALPRQLQAAKEKAPAWRRLLAEVDPAAVAAARAKIPSLRHGRRFELVEPLAEPTYLHAVREPL